MERNKNLGGRPKKSPTTVFSIRVSVSEFEDLSKMADKHSLSVGKFIQKLISEHEGEKKPSNEEFLKSQLYHYIRENKHITSAPMQLADEAIRVIYAGKEGSDLGNPWYRFDMSEENWELTKEERYTAAFNYAERCISET